MVHCSSKVETLKHGADWLNRLKTCFVCVCGGVSLTVCIVIRNTRLNYSSKTRADIMCHYMSVLILLCFPFFVVLQSYECVCHSGWEGEFCQREIDECLSQPCKNNATCTDLLNSYK